MFPKMRVMHSMLNISKTKTPNSDDKLDAQNLLQGHQNRRSMTPVLLVGYVLTICAGCLQLYFLIRAVTSVSSPSYDDYYQPVFVAFFFFLFTILFIGRYLVTMLFAFIEGSKQISESIFNDIDAPLVTILIPCFNEEGNIEKTIQSALNVDYPALEIIVIDDGSTDNTLKMAQEYISVHNADIKLITQKNSGKSTALNAGYKQALGEYILSMDADSELEPQSIRKLVARSLESNAGAVAGMVRIKNTRNMLTYLQQLEYVMMNGTARLFQSFFSSVLVSPGPISLFSRAALERTVKYRNDIGLVDRKTEDGPWESVTFAEDALLSMTMLAAGESCVFEPNAVCLTQAPDSSGTLMNQRYRWIRGNLQAALSVWDLWKRAPSRKPNLSIWILWFIIELIIWPIVDVFGVIIIVIMLTTSGAPIEAFFWYLILMSTDIAAVMFAATASNSRRRLAILVPFYRLGYGILLQSVSLMAFWDQKRNAKMKWS